MPRLCNEILFPTCAKNIILFKGQDTFFIDCTKAYGKPSLCIDCYFEFSSELYMPSPPIVSPLTFVTRATLDIVMQTVSAFRGSPSEFFYTKNNHFLPRNCYYALIACLRKFQGLHQSNSNILSSFFPSQIKSWNSI